VFTLTVSLPDESWCTSLLRNVRWDKGRVECPHCHSYDTKKDGRYRSYYQKYFCKQCERWFNDKTDTIFHYSHTPLKKWFLVIYLYFVLWPGCFIREISSEVVIPYPRYYGFIRTVMEKLSSSSILSTIKLDGITECDEFYIKAGLKGRSYHDEIVRTAKRQPRKRGLKPWRGRGTFDKDHPMITCFHQRGNEVTYFDVPSADRPLVDLICKNIKYGSTVYTDEYRAYDSLEEHGFIHESVNHSEKEYANGTIHVNNYVNAEATCTRYG
jgi:transposase-like protein